MNHWVVGGCVALLLTAGPAAPSGQVPGALPAESDSAAARLTAQVKTLKRDLTASQMDGNLRAQERILNEIIATSIELGEDETPYWTQLLDVRERLQQEHESALNRQKQHDRLVSLKQGAVRAFSRGSLEEARTLLDEARELAPQDAEAQQISVRVDRALARRWWRRVIGFGLLGVVAGGGALAGFVALKKRRRVAVLEMIHGPQPGELFRLDKEQTAVGSLDTEADWVIRDPSRRISRRHCDISRVGRHYFLTDRSTNGTFVNGRQVPSGEPVLLRRGDHITLAEDVVLRLR